MATVPTFTKTGAKSTTNVKLPVSIFSEMPKTHVLLHQAYLTDSSKHRISGARSLTRAEVRGGGRKPWRQKGTGRARVGSNRSPIWRGGGITFGPTGQENYTKKLNSSAKKKALRQALTLKSEANKISVIEEFIIKDGKSKTAQSLLNKVDSRQILVLAVDISSETRRAVNNLAQIKLCNATYLNVASVLDADTILITKPALAAIETWLGEKS